MKHVFFISTHTAMIVSKAIIKKYEIEDYLLVTSRGMVGGDVRIDDIKYEKWKIRENRAKVVERNRRVDEIGGDFILFMPFTSSNVARRLLRNCRKVHCIEDGATAYFTMDELYDQYDQVNWKYDLKRFIAERNISTGHLWNMLNKFERYYTIADGFVQFNPERLDPELPKENKYKIIFAPGALVAKNLVPPWTYIRIIDEVAKKIGEKFHYRLHPFEENKESIERILDCRGGIKIEHQDPLEYVLSECTLITDSSGIAFYAKEVKSYNEIIIKHHPPYKKYLETLPQRLLSKLNTQI